MICRLSTNAPASARQRQPSVCALNATNAVVRSPVQLTQRQSARSTPVVALDACTAVATGGRAAAVACRAAASALSRTSEPHLQLATAKLPSASQPAAFADSMYQWAATLSQSGANLPFVLPLKADKLPNGFQISLLRRSNKTNSFGSAGDIVATVEEADGVGNVFVVRFYEGEVAQDNRSPGSQPPADPVERLEVVISSLKDVDTIMSTMPQAIRKAAIVSS